MSIFATEATGGMAARFAAGTQNTGTQNAGTQNTASKNSLDQDTFLKLLVAQLRNQDPMKPTDSSEFLAQTAQFTSVEKLQVVADQTTQALAAQMAFGASSLVGRTVTYGDADGTEVSGTVGSVRFGGSGPVLKIDGEDVPLSDVMSVHQSGGTTGEPGPTGDSTGGT